MTKYLSIDEVLVIHEEMINLFGGRADVHDFTLFHSAVERPKATFGGVDLYPTIFEKAAAFVHSLILNHPFDDGNKRTAITSTARFLYLNGWHLQLPKTSSVKFTLAIDGHRYSFNEIVDWLKKHTKRIVV